MSIFPLLDLPVELTERILLSADVPTVLRVMQVYHNFSTLRVALALTDLSPDRTSHVRFYLRLRGNPVQDPALLPRLRGCSSRSYFFIRGQTRAVGRVQAPMGHH